MVRVSKELPRAAKDPRRFYVKNVDYCCTVCLRAFVRPFSIEDKSKSKKCNLPNILLKHFTLASSIDAKVSKITKAKVKNHHLTASNF